jgi:hypothetical protein
MYVQVATVSIGIGAEMNTWLARCTRHCIGIGMVQEVAQTSAIWAIAILNRSDKLTDRVEISPEDQSAAAALAEVHASSIHPSIHQSVSQAGNCIKYDDRSYVL